MENLAVLCLALWSEFFSGDPYHFENRLGCLGSSRLDDDEEVIHSNENFEDLMFQKKRQSKYIRLTLSDDYLGVNMLNTQVKPVVQTWLLEFRPNPGRTIRL